MLPQDIMHTILEGVLQYESKNILQYFFQNKLFSISQLNASILNHNYGYSEIGDKPNPLKEQLFCKDSNYKLRYKASQARLFLRLLPFYLDGYVNIEDEYYVFLTELINIVQILYSPLITTSTIQSLRQCICKHLEKFTQLFPDKNIIPKQHYMIHLPTMITQVGPLIRSSCFAFESAHNQFKKLARIQNFKNITLSLAKRYQLLECSYFGDINENPCNHPLFSSEAKYCLLCKTCDEQLENLRKLFDNNSLLPGISLKDICCYSWVTLHGTTYRRGAVLAVSVTIDPTIPVFGVIKDMWVFHYYTYFEVELLDTVCFETSNQAYQVEYMEPGEYLVCAYEHLVDFNVFHLKTYQDGRTFVLIKYDIDDIAEEYLKGFRIVKM